MVLCEFANRDKNQWPEWVPRSISGWLAWPSARTIAAVSGFSERAVRAALAELEVANAIQCQCESKGGAAYHKTDGTLVPARSNAYLITLHLVQGLD